VAEILVGYARCSTTSQDVRAQLSALKQLGVTDEHLHTDRGRTGRNRERPGLTAALGAVRDGDVLVVTKLDRLGRSARDLHDIAAELAGKGVKLSIGGSIHDPGDPIGKMFFGMLALMARVRVGPDPLAHRRGHAGGRQAWTTLGQALKTVGTATEATPRGLRIGGVQRRAADGHQRPVPLSDVRHAEQGTGRTAW